MFHRHAPTPHPGGVDYLRKPFGADALLPLVKQLIAGAEQASPSGVAEQLKVQFDERQM